MHMQTI